MHNIIYANEISLNIYFYFDQVLQDISNLRKLNFRNRTLQMLLNLHIFFLTFVQLNEYYFWIIYI